ncbi:MAG TPA: PAS domain S-box protein, partial [Ignavibacteria bacterium]
MKTKKFKALIIEDSKDDLKLMLRELEKGSYEIEYTLVMDAKGLEISLKEEWDVIISDYSLPGFSGLEALKMCNEKGIDIPFIIVSGTVGEDIAVDTMKYGAKDYIMKNNLIRLLPAIEREIIDAKIRKEKIHAEEELRESEKKYHTIFESTGTAALIVEDDTTISMANTECFKLTGYSSEELVGSKWTNYIEPSCLQEMIKNHNLRSQNTELAPKKYEVKLINKQGEVRNAVLDIGMISETKQRIVSILDITERKQAEENTQLLAHTIKSIAEIITITDLEDKLTFVNQAFVDIYGYSSDEIIGKHVKILRSPNNPPELFKDLLEHSRKNGWKGELLNL